MILLTVHDTVITTFVPFSLFRSSCFGLFFFSFSSFAFLFFALTDSLFFLLVSCFLFIFTGSIVFGNFILPSRNVHMYFSCI